MKIHNEIEIDNNTPLYAIGVVAQLLDVSVHVIRMYEMEGLIIPFKKDSRHRLYSNNDITRLKCIRSGINEHKLSIASIKTLYSMIPCWSIKNCSPEERNVCEAFSGSNLPCWSYKHKNNLCELQECKNCEVYTNHTNCESIKDSIKLATR
ncbi:MAG: MerR family transcriptional regulator [Ignavibacteria bacterium]|nr:MerR family transcriptional regulator [Ignavibacteria bacterium]